MELPSVTVTPPLNPFVFAVCVRRVLVVLLVRISCLFCRFRLVSGRPVNLAGSNRLVFLDPWFFFFFSL
jgi:hypothetical protein